MTTRRVIIVDNTLQVTPCTHTIFCWRRYRWLWQEPRACVQRIRSSFGFSYLFFNDDDSTLYCTLKNHYHVWTGRVLAFNEHFKVMCIELLVWRSKCTRISVHLRVCVRHGIFSQFFVRSFIFTSFHDLQRQRIEFNWFQFGQPIGEYIAIILLRRVQIDYTLQQAAAATITRREQFNHEINSRKNIMIIVPMSSVIAMKRYYYCRRRKRYFHSCFLSLSRDGKSNQNAVHSKIGSICCTNSQNSHSSCGY